MLNTDTVLGSWEDLKAGSAPNTLQSSIAGVDGGWLGPKRTKSPGFIFFPRLDKNNVFTS